MYSCVNVCLYICVYVTVCIAWGGSEYYYFIITLAAGIQI